MAAVMMERSGLTTVYFDNEGWTPTESVASSYYEKLSPVGYLGFLMGSSIFGTNNSQALLYQGVPAPQIWLSERVSINNNSATIVDRLMSQTGLGNRDIDLRRRHTQTGTAIPDVDAVEEWALFFTGDISNDPNCCRAADVSHLALPPGDFTASFSMKVSDRSDTSPVIGLSVIEQGSSDPNAVNDYVSLAPSDFAADLVYEDVSVSFSLDNYTANLDIVAGYEGGSADLYIDELRVELHVALSARRALKVQGTIDFAALQRRTHLTLEGLFFRAQLFGQSKLHLKVAMIHGA